MYTYVPCEVAACIMRSTEWNPAKRFPGSHNEHCRLVLCLVSNGIPFPSSKNDMHDSQPYAIHNSFLWWARHLRMWSNSVSVSRIRRSSEPSANAHHQFVPPLEDMFERYSASCTARQCWLVIHAVPGDVSTRCWLAQGTPPIPQPFAGVYEALVHMWTAIM